MRRQRIVIVDHDPGCDYAISSHGTDHRGRIDDFDIEHHDSDANQHIDLDSPYAGHDGRDHHDLDL